MRRDNWTVFPRDAEKAIRASSLSLPSVLSNLIICTNPVAVIQTVSLIFNFDWINAIALIVTIVGGFFIAVILTHLHDSHVWKQIIDGYFRDFNSQYFEPTIIEELEQSFENTWGLIRSRMEMVPFLSRFLNQKLRAFYVYPKGQGGTSPTVLKTYQMGSSLSYVFLPPETMALQEQLPEKLRQLRKRVRRFFLLHEIGHANTMHLIIDMWVWMAVPNFCLLFVFVIFHREVGILTLLTLLVLATMWVFCFLQQQGNRKECVELVADAFALVHLARRPDFRTTIAHIARMSRKQSKFWHYRARLLVRRAQILSGTRSKFSLRWGQEGGNWLEEIMPPIPLWLNLVFFAGMLWLGATLRIKDWKELGALSLLWLIGPAAWYYYYTFIRVNLTRTARSRRVALKFLQAHAPPDLPVERQVKTVFDLM